MLGSPQLYAPVAVAPVPLNGSSTIVAGKSTWQRANIVNMVVTTLLLLDGVVGDAFAFWHSCLTLTDGLCSGMCRRACVYIVLTCVNVSVYMCAHLHDVRLFPHEFPLALTGF